jgi:S1-C subfamily serine protease
MQRSRIVPVMIVFLALSLATVACSVSGPSVTFLNSATRTPLARAIQQLIATPTVAPGSVATAPALQSGTAAPVPTAAPTVSIKVPAELSAESQILEQVYIKVNPSVVRVSNLAHSSDLPSTSDAIPQGEGSGFVWDTQGNIITNNHVVSDAEQLQVVFADGTLLEAKLVGADPDSDLAVIRVDPKLVTLVPVEQADMSAVHVGQRAIAIGNPFGYAGTMTQGIVSALGRSIPSITNFSIPQSIQTDAAINPGNSGGPLLNERGQVIGVNAQIRSTTRSNTGVGFAIPINIVQRVAPALIKTGTYQHAYLGISGGNYTRAWAQDLGFGVDQKGAYVLNVVKGTPADKAGLKAGTQNTKVILSMDLNGPVYLQKGGDLITAIDGQPIRVMDDLLIYLETKTSPGQSVQLTIQRVGQAARTVKVDLAARPRSDVVEQ